MGTGYNPTRIIAADTGKIRMARRFVRAMREPRGFDYSTLLELAEVLEEAGRAEEAVKVLEFAFARIMRGESARAETLLELAAAFKQAGRAEEAVQVQELADARIGDALAPLNQTIVDTQQSGDLPAQCFAFIALALELRSFGRKPQADSAFKSAEELSDRIAAIVRQAHHEPALFYSWIAGLYSLNELYRALHWSGREEAAERLEERCNGFGRSMADAAIEIGFKDVAQAQEDQDPHREGKAMAMLARALHEVGRKRESAFCGAEALRLGQGNYRKISVLYSDWSSTAKPGSNDPAAYGYNDPAAYGYDDTPPPDKPIGPINGPLSPEIVGEVIVGYLAIKTLGPFLQAFATKLGEQLGEATGRAISRLYLRRRPHARDQVEVEAGTKTIVILPEPFTDNEREAFIDIDVTDPHVRGKTLHWDGNQGKFLPEGESSSDPGQG